MIAKNINNMPPSPSPSIKRPIDEDDYETNESATQPKYSKRAKVKAKSKGPGKPSYLSVMNDKFSTFKKEMLLIISKMDIEIQSIVTGVNELEEKSKLKNIMFSLV